MTDRDDEEIVTFRLGPVDRAAIQRLVTKGVFRNRSDFLRDAVKQSLRGHAAQPASTTRVPDLELEGVQLPPASATPKRHAPGRLSRGRSP